MRWLGIGAALVLCPPLGLVLMALSIRAPRLREVSPSAETAPGGTDTPLPSYWPPVAWEQPDPMRVSHPMCRCVLVPALPPRSEWTTIDAYTK